MSRTEYKIGHFAVLKNTGDAEYEGQRCEILTSLSPQVIADSTGRERMIMGYEVLMADGSHMILEATKMADVTREMDRMVRWSDCAWQPKPLLVDIAVLLHNLVQIHGAMRGMQ